MARMHGAVAERPVETNMCEPDGADGARQWEALPLSNSDTDRWDGGGVDEVVGEDSAVGAAEVAGHEQCR